MVNEYEDFIMHWTFKVFTTKGWRIAYKEDGEYSQETTHKEKDNSKIYGFYSIYDEYRVVKQEFTKEHIEYSCNLAKGENKPKDIAESVGPDTTGNKRFYKDRSLPGDMAWQIIDGNLKADCRSLAYLMKNVLELLGLKGAKIMLVYGCHKNWSHLTAPGDETVSFERNPETGEKLLLWIGSPYPGENDWEGCCLFRGQWWMGGAGEFKNSAKKVLLYLIKENKSGLDNPHQYWSDDRAIAVPYPGQKN